ncbi:DUF1289 domain-containing protein [Paludisphaera mucosa]|uniref:DUF1289 domain-containing protein n=1 Tax=Paludisphaera mucosa TaxID=3030827 RepID=A0ABT6FH19_9BACT|nr:DUF1289 domain-containing protein [Paludisphaera mucosa]
MTTSPCLGFCRLDASSSQCLGCARTADEITAWRDAPPAFLERVWSELPARRERLGVGLHRLKWTRDGLVDFIAGTLRAGGGAWAFGNFGGASEFRVDPGEDCTRELIGPSRVVARTARAAIRFDVPEPIRVLSRARPGAEPRRGPLVLAVPRGRSRPGARPGLAAFGPDRDAIDGRDRDARLYDLGLPARGAAFCLRTDDPGLIRRLDDCLGLEWPDLFSNLGRRIVEASPARVVLGPIGRVEAFAPIAAIDDREPLAPIQLAGGRDVPNGLESLDALAPCAFYFPDEAASGSPSP